MKGKKLYIKADSIFSKLYADHPKLNIDERQNSYDEYLKILRASAYKGYPEAQYNLAQHYDDIGYWGVPNPYYNPRKKFYWYSKAASQNHFDALNNLANMYEKGEFCQQNIRRALELYEQAAKSGITYIKNNYKLLLKQIEQGKYKLEDEPFSII